MPFAFVQVSSQLSVAHIRHCNNFWRRILQSQVGALLLTVAGRRGASVKFQKQLIGRGGNIWPYEETYTPLSFDRPSRYMYHNAVELLELQPSQFQQLWRQSSQMAYRPSSILAAALVAALLFTGYRMWQRTKTQQATAAYKRR